jgi:hypothetical protein
MKTDREIYLNDLQISLIKKAIADGKKSIITHDLLINIYPERITVLNAHTGKEMTVKNFKR